MMNARWFPLLIIASVTAGVASSAGGTDLGAIKARGVLKVIALKDEASEMFNLGAGDPGFEREIVEGFARLHRIKVEPTIVATAPDRITALNAGEGDLIIGIVDTPERRQHAAFTSEVIPVRHLVISFAPHPPVQSMEEFKARRIGIVVNTSWARAVAEAGIPEASTEQFTTTGLMLEALRSGRITASVMSIADFILFAKANLGLEAGMFIGTAGSSAFAVRSADVELLSAVNQYLANFRRSGSWNRLIVKYFGERALSVLGRS